MSQKLLDFNGLRDQLKEFLTPYLIQNGVQINKNGMFSCISPDHTDNNPSCGLVPASDNRVFHCLGCGISGTIFEAAAMLEGKPLSGIGFLHDNLIYLANTFGVEVPEIETTPEKLYEYDIYTAYAHAASYIKSCTPSERVQTKIKAMSWPKDVLTKIGVGSVASYEDYITKMTKSPSEGGYGHKLEFLREIDLTRKALFNPDNLIFTVKDEHGAPVGFAARNLKYEEEKTNYDKQRKEIIEVDGENSPQLKELWHPSKYLNTAETGMKNHIYQKSKRLFNFDQARKCTPPLYVVEGYADAVTMVSAGIKNACAIGSTSFSREHLNLVLNVGDKSGQSIKHIIFVLDADPAGEEGTKRFVAMLEDTMSGHVGLRVEIVIMPEGTDDPDKFIRDRSCIDGVINLVKGGDAFRKLERLDMFSWRLKQAIKEGEEPLVLAERVIPMIVNEQNYLQRMHMTDQLASQTSLDKQGLWREVMRRVDEDAMNLDEEKVIIAKRTASELLRNSKDIQAVLSNAQSQIEIVERRRTGYDPSNIVKALEYIMDRSNKNMDGVELVTGYKVLDQAFGGLPKGDAFISLPGKPSVSKSTFLQNLAFRLLDHNNNLIVFFHTVDDALSAFTPRLLGANFKVPSNWFKKAGYYLNDPIGIHATKEWLARNEISSSFQDIYAVANQWLKEQVASERLIIADVSCLPATIPAHEAWVKTIRKRFPSKDIVVIGDNFHLFDFPGFEAGEEKVRAISKAIKRMANEQHCTCLFSCELPKESLKPGVRPRVANIKGTAGVAYDANANLGVYNDLKDMGHKATIFWSDDKDMDSVPTPMGPINHIPKRKPVVELVIDKSKLSSFDGTIYYKLWPETGRMEEVSEEEQVVYRNRVNDGDRRT